MRNPYAPLTASAIQAGLRTRAIGRSVTCLSECPSTNDVARTAAAAGAPDGAVFTAEAQTAGRGQRGRTWLASPGTCVLMSILLRPDRLPAQEAHLITMLAACAGAAAAEAVAGRPCPLKWPNDLILADRKVAGILVETSLLGEQLEFAVVGVGLNVNLDVAACPEIAETATSLSTELGREVDRAAIVRELLRQVDERYTLLREGASGEIFAEWRRRLGTLGQRVVVVDPRGVEETGMAEDVAPDGTLLVRRTDGTRRSFRVGDVSLQKPSIRTGR